VEDGYVRLRWIGARAGWKLDRPVVRPDYELIHDKMRELDCSNSWQTILESPERHQANR
jgi:hypothetical protein